MQRLFILLVIGFLPNFCIAGVIVSDSNQIVQSESDVDLANWGVDESPWQADREYLSESLPRQGMTGQSVRATSSIPSAICAWTDSFFQAVPRLESMYQLCIWQFTPRPPVSMIPKVPIV